MGKNWLFDISTATGYFFKKRVNPDPDPEWKWIFKNLIFICGCH